MSRSIELEKINNNSDNGFRYGMMECRYFPKRLHFHPEMELVYINKGEGLCFAGNGITQFKPGELFFFSSNISHYFRSAPQFYAPNFPLKCGSTYLQFKEGVLPANYRIMPGCNNITRLIIGAEQGLKWSSKDLDPNIITQIEQMELMHGFERLIQLFDLLDKLGRLVDKSSTIATSYTSNMKQNGNDNAYKKVIEYITHNFHRTITLDELADHAGMNRTALCRHFRNRADRSIFDFLLEFRITYARQQLISTRLPISEIAVESGFNNLPNFNVQFKKLTNCTPGEYRVRGVIANG
ncbi:MAG: AraC family transcriptional regulator [Rikenellaceae bacterium]